MEDIKESKKVLTDYMLELNADIQRAEDWVNTGADEEMYFALKTVLDRLEQLEQENEFWKEYKEKLDKLDTKDFIFKHELENYIPKSVIREKIEQFKRLSAEIQGYDYECIPKDLKRNDYAVKMLKELLGEK